MSSIVLFLVSETSISESSDPSRRRSTGYIEYFINLMSYVDLMYLIEEVGDKAAEDAAAKESLALEFFDVIKYRDTLWSKWCRKWGSDPSEKSTGWDPLANDSTFFQWRVSADASSADIPLSYPVSMVSRTVLKDVIIFSCCSSG